jgi:hypothetical protein
MKKDTFKVSLIRFIVEQVYAKYFELYLVHHQANSIKHKLSYMNLVALIWTHMDAYGSIRRFNLLICCLYSLKCIR